MGLQNSSDDLDDYGDHQAENDHRSDREIKSEILFFYPDVARQSSDPVKFIMKEINQNAQHYDHYACDDDIFSRVTVHCTKIIFLRALVFSVDQPGWLA